MSKLVKLEYGIVKVGECEVGSYDVGVRVICGVLNGSELVNAVLSRYNYDSTGMLTRSTLNAYASLGKPVYIRLGKSFASRLKVL